MHALVHRLSTDTARKQTRFPRQFVGISAVGWVIGIICRNCLIIEPTQTESRIPDLIILLRHS